MASLGCTTQKLLTAWHRSYLRHIGSSCVLVWDTCLNARAWGARAALVIRAPALEPIYQLIPTQHGAQKRKTRVPIEHAGAASRVKHPLAHWGASPGQLAPGVTACQHGRLPQAHFRDVRSRTLALDTYTHPTSHLTPLPLRLCLHSLSLPRTH